MDTDLPTDTDLLTDTVTSAPMAGEAERARRLRRARARATGLLAAVSAVFVATVVLGDGTGWVGYVQAMAEAGMVGGLADWFAVTALFRHPLGIPVPHTAVIVTKRDQFAATLGSFIQERLLTPDVIVARVRSAGVVDRMAAWLAEPANAERVAAEVARAGAGLVDVIDDEQVQTMLEEVVRERVASIELAPLAGRALRFVTEDGRHDQVLDAALRGLDRYLDDHREELRQRLGDQSPWWLPRAAEDQIFERLLAGARAVLHDMTEDQQHDLRRQFDERIRALADDLQSRPDLLARGEELKQEVLAQPEVRALAATLWQDAKAQLRDQAADPASALRRRLAEAVQTTGHRLRTDPDLARRAEEGLEALVGYGARRFEGEIAGVVTSTIERWDTEETARRLELLLGPDLQYIRINGTVVGALAGLVLHALAQLAGG